jgi:subtilisin family serine protease
MESSRTFDAYVDAGIIATISSGNNGSNYDTINVPGDAFNVITVGNMNDQGTTNRADDTLSPSSSRGMTGDGRTKPEVAAPGTSIMSTAYNWEGANPDFFSMSGTSMAAPHVAGLAALLIDYWAIVYGQRIAGNGNPAGSSYYLHPGSPLLVRAMIFAGADETTGEYTGIGASGSWNDRRTGAGYVDSWESIKMVDRHKVAIDYISQGQQKWYAVVAPNGTTCKASIVWNRHVDVATKTPKNLSDLDLYLGTSPGSSNLDYSADAQTNWGKVGYTNSSGSTKTYYLTVYGYYIPSAVRVE